MTFKRLHLWIGRIAAAGVLAFAAQVAAAQDYVSTVQPLLENYCYDCHGDGASKGNVAFDGFTSGSDRIADLGLWEKVLKNLRAQVMPPAKKPRPTADEQATIENWIKYTVFKIDPKNPDPGRVTLRRLNRVEYQNTIRDLMGIEFRAYEEFPPDDTGYGFDNIGDVLTTSPLLLEKYMDAAETIVTKAVPVISRVVAEQSAPGGEFKSADGKLDARNISFYRAADVAHSFKVGIAGDYTLDIDAEVSGDFNFDPGRMKLTVKLGEDTLVQEEHKWQDGKKVKYEFTRHLPAGEAVLSMNLEPLVPEDQKKTRVDFRLRTVTLKGPLAKEHWIHPDNYTRFFTRDEPPGDAAARREYAAEVLRRFASRAFRRPVDDKTVQKLAAIAEREYTQPGKSFEFGVSRAMVAVLASPRFIVRTEGMEPDPRGGHPFVDEYALASRLSYFLWSTMPDAELMQLAGRHELRQNLGGQVKRMLADKRSQEFVENFVGQWLETRDVEGISINERSVLARDSGDDRQQDSVRERFAELRAIPEDQLTPEQKKEFEEIRASFRARFRKPAVELNDELRRAMRRESEMAFDYILRENRSVVEFLESDYAFVNEPLAKLYGLADVKGPEMRKVALPPDSPRGGILTEGSVLVVTSNPTRTSPVKRGVFLLDEILGTPAPPPPANVPQLEESEKAFKDHEPTLRETLELHRSKPLCKSCHSRMDPLGLALENFNALGMWRDSERKQPIEAAGRLITGEEFANVRELKHILATDRRLDFYRCLTGKLLTYALGRGLEYYDTQAVDDIVARLQKEDGRFSALLTGVIESVPFQKRREGSDMTQNRAPGPARQIVQSETSEQP